MNDKTITIDDIDLFVFDFDGEKRVIEAEVPIAKNLRQHLDWE